MKPKLSYSEFMANCKKTLPRTRVYYTYLYHQVTYPLSYLLYLLSFTANSISILGILISIAGGVFIFIGQPIFGTSLFLFSYLLDCCDGNVARIHYGFEGRPRGNTLSLGMLLENFYPNVSYPLFFLSLGTYLFNETGSLFFVWLSVGAGMTKLINRYTVLHASHLNKPIAVVAGGTQTNKEIYSEGALNEFKYFIVRVVDSARMYYVVFLLVLLFAPMFLVYAFTAYMSLVIILNVIKTLLTLKSRTP